MPRWKRLWSFAALTVMTAVIASGCIRTKDMRNRWAYQCPDGYSFDMEFSRNGTKARFEDAEGVVSLTREEAASGARYVRDEYVVWTKGALATIYKNDQLEHGQCQGEKR